jgi:hypothetical protein
MYGTRRRRNNGPGFHRRKEIAFNKFHELGFTPEWNDRYKCFIVNLSEDNHTEDLIRYFPGSEWFSGRAVKDGRGLHKLLIQIKNK